MPDKLCISSEEPHSYTFDLASFLSFPFLAIQKSRRKTGIIYHSSDIESREKVERI